MTKLSPREREEFEAKVKRAGVSLSDGARDALAKWNPPEKRPDAGADRPPGNVVKTVPDARG